MRTVKRDLSNGREQYTGELTDPVELEEEITRDIDAEVQEIEEAERKQGTENLGLGPFEQRCKLCHRIVDILTDQYTALSSRSLICYNCSSKMVRD